MTLSGYLSQDRLRALASGEDLPDRTTGSALFADISGFTVLTTSLRKSLGVRRGGEELPKHLNAVYTALINEVERLGGSVISFAGDAIICWFDDAVGTAAERAVGCAFALQQAMRSFATISLPDRTQITLSLKVAVATGSARRFLVGDPAVHYLDVLAGAVVEQTAVGEQLAQQAEILLDDATVQELGQRFSIQEWRFDPESGQRFAVAGQFTASNIYKNSLSSTSHPIPTTDLRPFLLPAVYKREKAGHTTFLTEFRPCAVLFVRFGEIDYEADDAQSQLDAFIRLLQASTEKYEGAILQLTVGDKGSYAYLNFGALTAHEDDVRRAVKTALDLQANVSLPLQIGITHGLTRVGTYGGETRQTYGALGDDVNLAAYLMTAANPGDILLSEHAHSAVQDEFVFEPQPPISIKGRNNPLSVFTLTGKRRHRAVRLQEPTYALPMVGRENELASISERLTRTLTGQGQVLGIVGEAGIGKSRLVAEVIRSAQRQGFVGYGGACQSDGLNTPYLVWKAVWQAFFKIDPDMPLHRSIRWLEGEIEDRVPSRIAALPLLGTILDLDIPDNDFTQSLEPKSRQSALHALLEDCLNTAVKNKPTLIVLEDLHWIDALSHNLLDQLARATANLPVCFVLAYRPPQLERLQTLQFESFPQFTRIDLHELNQAEAEQAIHAKLAQLYPARSGKVPEELMATLFARTQGNPFYLEELLNFLRDRGFDPRDPAVLEKIELPTSLHTLILSRIDQLSEQEKNTLRVASVIGRLFRARWLTGYYPKLGADAQIKKALDRLDTLDITPLDSPEPELTYLFKHIVTHEVTYQSLPFAVRAKLHEQLANYLEAQIAAGNLQQSSMLDVLVYHYTRSENKAKQRTYLYKAGQAAFDLSAFNTGVEYLTRSLELTPTDDPARTEQALQLADVYRAFADFPSVRKALDLALDAAQTDADRAIALAALGEWNSDLGKYTTAQEILTAAVPLARASGNVLTLSRALYALGEVTWRLGKLDDARAALIESLALARALGNSFRELFALNRLATVSAVEGDLVDAKRLFKEVYNRAQEVGNRERMMAALNNLGEVEKGNQDYEVALDYFHQALTIAREIGTQSAVALFIGNIAEMHIRLKQFSAVPAELQEGLSLALRLQAMPFVISIVMSYGHLAHAKGQVERALMLYGMARNHPCVEQ